MISNLPEANSHLICRQSVLLHYSEQAFHQLNNLFEPIK